MIISSDKLQDGFNFPVAPDFPVAGENFVLTLFL